MTNSNYTEGITELQLKVRERDAILEFAQNKITNFFVEPGPDSRKGLLEALCGIREVLGIGYDWDGED